MTQRPLPGAFALLLRSQLRFAWTTPLTTATALLGLALGIASIVAVHQICDRVVASLDAVVPAHLRAVTHRASRPALAAPDYFALRRSWRDGALPQISAMAPYLEGRLSVRGQPLTVSGTDWLAMPSDAKVTGDRGAGAQGSGASNLGALAFGAAAYGSGLGGLQTGDRLRLAGRDIELLGSTDPDGQPRLIADIALAHELLAPQPAQRLSAVLLRVDDPLAALRRLLNQFLPGFDAGLPVPAGPVLPGWQVQDLTLLMPEQRFGRSVLFNLGALGTLSILVAWFLMYQTALLWFRRQQPVFDLLRQQGVGEPALLGSFALALGVLSAVASALGALLGSLLARFLLQQIGNVERAGAAPWPPALVLKVLLTAVLVPAVSVFLVRQVAAARVPAQGLRWGRAVLFLGLAGLTAGLAIWPGGGLLGGFGAILAGCALLVTALVPLLNWLRGRAWLGLGLHLRMGLRELLWHPRDLAAALGALALAVATSIGIATMVQSFRDDFELMLDQRLADAIRIEGPAPALRALAEGLPAPQTRRYEQARVLVNGLPVTLQRSQLDGLGASRFGQDEALGRAQVLLSEAAARLLQLGQGDPVTIGGRRFAIAGIYPGYGDLEATAQIDAASGDLVDGLQQPVLFELRRLGLPAAAAPAGVDQLVAELTAAWPRLEVAAQADVRRRAVEIFDQTFAITRALTAVALLVAAVGLYSALTALGLTESRSRRLLLYLGQTPGERLGFALGRALAATLVTLLLAVPLGLLIAAMLCYVVNPRGFGWSVPLAPSLPAVLWPLAWAFLAALLAGVLGDRHEAR